MRHIYIWWMSVSVEVRAAIIGSALSTIPIAFIAWRGLRAANNTLNEIKSQTGVSRTAANAAEGSAKAALASANAMVNTERAILEVDLVAPNTDIDPDTGREVFRPPDSPSGYELFRFAVSVTNHGRTVARIIAYRVLDDCVLGARPPENFQWSIRYERHRLLGAGKSDILGNHDASQMFGGEKNWKSMTDNEKTGVLKIEVEYDDVIREEAGKHHLTSAVWSWDAQEQELIRNPQYNEYF